MRGEEALSHLHKNLLQLNNNNSHQNSIEAFKEFSTSSVSNLVPLLRLFMKIIEIVDQSTAVKNKQKYVEIVKAQAGAYELQFIFYYCISSSHSNLSSNINCSKTYPFLNC